MFSENDAHPTIPVVATTRPKRIAFLVDVEKVSNDEVNEIIRFNTRIWGGRFNPIIPVQRGDITGDWWSVLVASDPDIVYSFLPLGGSLIDRINRKILPAKIFEITDEDRARREGVVGVSEWDLRAITTQGIPRYSWGTRGGIWGDPHFYHLIDSRRKNEARVFALRNFGVLPKDITTATMFRELPSTEIEPDKVAINAFFAPEFYPGRQRPVFPLDLATLFAGRRFSLAYEHRVPGFHLVIGDSPWEAIYLWNLALQERSRAGREALWLPASAVEDSAFLADVGVWIGKVFWGNEGERRGAVVSYTLPKEKLEAVAKIVSPAAHLYLPAVQLKSGVHPFPGSFEKVQLGHERHAYLEETRFTNTEQVPLSDNQGLVHLIKPAFHDARDSQFGWMVDLDIGFRPERYFYTNVRPIWRLPKRVGIPHLFAPQGGPRGRVTWSGAPSFEVTASDDALSLRIPSDEGVIWASCFDSHHTNTEKRHPQQAQQFDEIATSDKGRHVKGMLELFGSMFHAGQFFGDPYWRAVAYILAGRPDPEKFRMQRVEVAHGVIRNWFVQHEQGFRATPENLKSLAEHVADNLTFRDGVGISLREDQLEGKFAQLRRDALEANPKSGYWNAYKKFDPYRRNDLAGHVANHILLQGVSIRCQTCFTIAWHGVDDLKSTVSCKGCLSAFPFPLSPKWSYRLNDLLANAIRYHGTISVIHALYFLEHFRSRQGMMIFLPCQDIYERRTNPVNDDDEDVSYRDGGLHFRRGTRYSDLDLLLINDGRLILGEVKSEASGFRPEDFEKLNVIASALRPDELILAAVGKTWGPEISGHLSRLAGELQKRDVIVTPLLLEWDD